MSDSVQPTQSNTALYIASLALLLAAYAAICTSSDSNTPETQIEALNSKIISLENRISDMDSYIVNLDKAIQNNKEKLIQPKLESVLQDVQDIGAIAAEKAKEVISDIQNMLPSTTPDNAPSNTEQQPQEPQPDMTIKAPTMPAAIEPAITDMLPTEPKSQAIESIEPNVGILPDNQTQL